MRFRVCPTLFCAALAALSPFVFAEAPTPERPDSASPDEPSTPTYAINWHAIDPGVARLHNSCFRLSATAGQAVPGYGSGGSYVVTSGFWAAAPTHGLDDIFFNGFEECGP